MASIITADTGAVSGTAGLKQSADSSGILALATGTGTTAVTIDASQNVGIGGASAGAKLQVTQNNGGIVVSAAAATSASIFITGNGNTAGATSFDLIQDASTAYVYNRANTPLVFGTNSAEKARIDSSGNLLVGTTSSSNTSGTGHKFDPNGRYSIVAPNSTADTFNYYNSTAGAFRFYVTAGGTIFATSTTISAISDERLKENIQDIDTGLDAVLALKPRRFDWKEGKGQDKKNAAGFIAQEFETVFPDSVGTSKAGEDGIEYKNICHEELIPTLVKAIQEQQALITTLTERISALEAK